MNKQIAKTAITVQILEKYILKRDLVVFVSVSMNYKKSVTLRNLKKNKNP
jgi:hypothetical protein